MYKKFIAVIIILMLIITNIVIADELFLKGSNIPSLKRDFPADPDKFTFAIIGDKTGGGENNWGIFDRAMDEINLLNPDFAMTIGDHVQGYTTDFAILKKMWDEYYLHLSTLKMPVLLVPGNHDISNTDMYIYWQGRNGKTYYSFNYKRCHFITINTEEDKSSEGAGIAEKALMDFVIKDIQQNKNAKHIFVFMHKPLWIENQKTWDQIEAELKGTNYSVFAGHYHNLTQDIHNNHKYIILSSTGAGLDEHADIPQLGMYHHFTVVSVEGKDAKVAIIQPGNIFSSSVSTKEYVDQMSASLPQLKSEIPAPSKDGETNGKLQITMKNKVDKPIGIKIIMADADGWRVTPKDKVLDAAPGEEKQATFELKYNAKSISTPPKYTIEIFYDGKSIGKQQGQISTK
jgi:hypothetical protein